MRTGTGFGVALIALAFGMAAAAPAQNADDAAIRAVETAQEAAWNAHDANAFAALFTPSGTFVSSLGTATSGREAIAERLGRGFASMFASSRMHVEEVTSQPLGADAATARMVWSISGAHRPDGSPIEDHRIVQTQTLQRVGGRWLIASAQDTVVLDGPAPAAMQAPPAASAAPSADGEPAKPRHCILGRANGDCLIPGKSK